MFHCGSQSWTDRLEPWEVVALAWELRDSELGQGDAQIKGEQNEMSQMPKVLAWDSAHLVALLIKKTGEKSIWFGRRVPDMMTVLWASI